MSDTGKIVEKYILSSEKMKDVYIDKYVIMPDHIHIMVVIKHNLNIIPDNKKGTSKAPSPTNQIIPRFVSTLKRLCNKEIGENIFQRSYIEHIIRDEDDYKTRVKYIYENPLKWYYNNH